MQRLHSCVADALGRLELAAGGGTGAGALGVELGVKSLALDHGKPTRWDADTTSWTLVGRRDGDLLVHD